MTKSFRVTYKILYTISYFKLKIKYKTIKNNEGVFKYTSNILIHFYLNIFSLFLYARNLKIKTIYNITSSEVVRNSTITFEVIFICIYSDNFVC